MARKPDWTEPTFDLFNTGEFESRKRVPKAASETSETVKYRRGKAVRSNCQDCSDLVSEGKRSSISLASYIRSDQSGSRFLCFFHTNERKHLDQLSRKI